MTHIKRKSLVHPAGQHLDQTETSVRQKLFAFLDKTYGTGMGATADDYDSREALLEYAIETVSEQGGLTRGCGVGPLMGDIEDWLETFWSGERADVSDEPFCLQVKFDPLKQGFILLRNEQELLEQFAPPTQDPEQYPVFARKEYVIDRRQSVLSYLYLSDMTLVP